MRPFCPTCHTEVRETDYFCFNCGKNLKAKPLSTSLQAEILYYAASIFLPPLGFWWGVKYLRQHDPVSKRIGIVSMLLTVIATIITFAWGVRVMNSVSSQVNEQMNLIQGF
ncbi:zinc ribbon domain-containing protein [Candidatus Gottesmanbacteria bacterium]|nr:zinc ribbon domain-containing protein [Candidatus Gottesmanbacteria bacterium]